MTVLCVNCKWHHIEKQYEYIDFFLFWKQIYRTNLTHRCFHPSSVSEKQNFITGEVEKYYFTCDQMRGENPCGPQGILKKPCGTQGVLFESKEDTN